MFLFNICARGTILSQYFIGNNKKIVTFIVDIEQELFLKATKNWSILRFIIFHFRLWLPGALHVELKNIICIFDYNFYQNILNDDQ